MCKKGLINKIKDLSKYVPKGINTIKDKTQINNTKPIQNGKQISQEKTKQIFNQTKRQMNDRSQMFKQYALKAKQLKEKAKDSIAIGTSNVINSASQIKKKIGEGARSGQQIALKSKEKLVNTAKQGINKSQQVLSKKAGQIKNSAGNLKQKIVESNILKQKNQAINQFIQKASLKKQSLSHIGSKIKEGIQYGKNNLSKNTEGMIKNTNQYTKKIFQVTKQKLMPQKVQKKLQLKPSVQQISKKVLIQYTKKQNQDSNQEKNKTKPNFYDKIWQKIKKSNDSAFSNLLIKNTKSKFSSMLTNMYWRLIFGACLIVFVFGVSTQLPRQIRLHFSQKNKLQINQQNIVRAQRQSQIQGQKVGI